MKIAAGTIAFIILLLIGSCSSNNATNEEISTPGQATIESYSANYGYIGDVITIVGTNFTTDIDQVKVFFDDTGATINSVSNQEIEIVLPEVSNTLPNLKVEIENRIITNNVQNEYNSRIGVLPNSKNKWHSMDFAISDDVVWRTQGIGQDKAYFSQNDNGAGGGIYRTIDGGLSWQRWASVGFQGTFHATANDEGWSDVIRLNKIPVGGSNATDYIFDPVSNINNTIIATYVDDDMQNGTVITSAKVAYRTTDGVNFNEVYNNSKDQLELFHFFAFDNDHIWAGGRSVESNKPLLLFLDGGTWKEVDIALPGDHFNVTKIQFISHSIGFVTIFSQTTGNKICKTVDGGNTWETVTEDFEYGEFAFKNETRGWMVKDNEIFGTSDGGLSWTLEYTNTSNFKSITYNDNVVWAISLDKALKYFTE